MARAGDSMAMGKKLCFERICWLAAARVCYEGGWCVKQIATDAKVSTKTVYSWLRQSNTVLRRK